jgi:hypothetical protein
VTLARGCSFLWVFFFPFSRGPPTLRICCCIPVLWQAGRRLGKVFVLWFRMTPLFSPLSLLSLPVCRFSFSFPPQPAKRPFTRTASVCSTLRRYIQLCSLVSLVFLCCYILYLSFLFNSLFWSFCYPMCPYSPFCSWAKQHIPYLYIYIPTCLCSIGLARAIRISCCFGAIAVES